MEIVNAALNQIVHITRVEAWIEASQLPARKRFEKHGDWDQSDVLWIRVPALRDKEGNEIRPAHTSFGRCVWPKKPIAFHPVGPAIDSAVRVEWGDDAPYYEYCFTRQRVAPSHWHPCLEPLPPDTYIPEAESGTLNQFIQINAETDPTHA